MSNSPKPRLVDVQITRERPGAGRTAKLTALLSLVLVVATGISCAVAPSSETSATPGATATVKRAGTKDLESAYGAFQQRDFAAAAEAYERVISGAKVKPQDRRLAYLGKALVHLSTDERWRDLDAAARLLQSAEAMPTGGGDLESVMLMNSLSALIGAEKNNSELNTKVSNSVVEIVRLKAERDDLRSEQAALNEALEKLKELAIGN